ncbi:hypothetical protein RB595_008976 [Gaeumannomyces hyphopodioides]
MPPPKAACIIGAGPGGLVAAKYLLEQRFPTPPGQLGSPRFKVTIYESKGRIGGLWPLSKDDTGGDIHPLMRANQSKHTVQYSDLAWGPEVPEFPHAWQVGQYLKRYYERYCSGAELKLNQRVDEIAPVEPAGLPGQWAVTTRTGDDKTEKKVFDCVIVGSGYFGKPLVPTMFKSAGVPVITSTEYRDLRSLFGAGLDNTALDSKIKAEPAPNPKILVVGGQMSGVEIAALIATHLSSAAYSPKERAIPNASGYSVVHIAEQPSWIFPLFTTPAPSETFPPFLPCDLTSYNLTNRPMPLLNTQGSLSVGEARNINRIFCSSLGGAQEDFGSVLGMRRKNLFDQPPLLAMSEHYSEFVRLGRIHPIRARVTSFSGKEGAISASEYNEERLDDTLRDVTAIVLATGFSASVSLSFLTEEVKARLGYQDPAALSKNRGHVLSLGFHSTFHPGTPGLGFVGFYRSPYWGVMEMQARFLATMFSSSLFGEPLPNRPQSALAGDTSEAQTAALRKDPRITQFPMGDYAWLMDQFAKALNIQISQPAAEKPMPSTPPSNLPMDVLTPARYISPDATMEQVAEAQEALRQTQEAIVGGLTQRKFLAHAVFRSLHGEWQVERTHSSPKYPDQNGHFQGKVTFHLREGTADGRALDKTMPSTDMDLGLEYLLIEEGRFTLAAGFEFQTTRRYIWRYDESRDKISVWFVLPDDNTRAEKLFHQLDFPMPATPGDSGGQRRQIHGAAGKAAVCEASGGHLCEQDYYTSRYGFRFNAVKMDDWTLDVEVKGPRKDYTTTGVYKRILPEQRSENKVEKA